MLSFNASLNRSALEQALLAAFSQGVQPEIKRMPVTVSENDVSYTLIAELPDGVKKENVSVSIDKETLTIQVKKDLEALPEGDKVCFDERRAVNIVRAFELSDKVGVDNHSAKVEGSRLTVVLQKAKPTEVLKIEVA